MKERTGRTELLVLAGLAAAAAGVFSLDGSQRSQPADIVARPAYQPSRAAPVTESMQVDEAEPPPPPRRLGERATNSARLAAAINVYAPSGVLGRLPGRQTAYTFVAKNTGNDSGTFLLSVACNGAAIDPPSCALSDMAVRTLSAGESTFVQADFRTLARGAAGTVVARGVLVADTTVRDTAFAPIDIIYSPDVRPDSLRVRNASASIVDSFVVQNTSSTTRTYNFTSGCTWQGSPLTCSVSPASASIASGATRTVTISYTSGALAQSGSVVLRAVLSNNSNVLDSGITTIATRAKPVFTPSARAVDGVPPNASGTQRFFVTNVSRAPATFNLAVVCNGRAIPSASCTISPSALSVAPGGTAAAQVAYASGIAGTGGRIRVTGTWSGSTVSDSVSLTVRTKNLGVSVGPDLYARPRGPLARAQRDTFFVRNTGREWDEYLVTARCSGAAVVSLCAVNQRLSVAPGDSAPVWVDYDAGPAGANGSIVVRARSVRDSALTVDSGVVSVAVSPALPVLGLRLSASGSIQMMDTLSSSTRRVTYDVTNLGNGMRDLYLMWATCGGANMVDSTCRVSPLATSAADSAIHSLGPNVTPGFPVTFKLKTPNPFGQSGYVRVRWENIYDRTIRDSALIDVYCCALTRTAVSTQPDIPSVSVRRVNTFYSDTFTVQNQGSGSDSMTLSIPNCPSVVNTCQLSAPALGNMAPNELRSVIQSYTTNPVPGRGTLRLRAESFRYLLTVDAGRRELLTAPDTNVRIAVTPKAASALRPHSRVGLVDTFVVSNVGTVTDSFALSTNCPTPVLQQGSCSISPSGVVTLAPKASTYAVVTYSTSSIQGVARLDLVATSQTIPTTSDVGSRQLVTNTSIIAVRVTPRYFNRFRNVSVSAAKDTFTVINSGSTADTFLLSVTCSAPVSGGSCGTNPTPILVNGMSSRDVEVTYNTAAAPGTGIITLVATSQQQPFVSGQAGITVQSSVPSTAAVAIMPDSGIRTRRISLTGVTDTFYVSNVSTQGGTFALTLTCDSPPVVSGSCSRSPTGNLVVNAGQSIPVVVTYNTTSTLASGYIRLAAVNTLNPTIGAQGLIAVSTVNPATIAVLVTPPNQARSRPTNVIGAVDTFTVSNTGSAPELFQLSATCAMPPVTPLGCTVSPQGPVLIANGANAKVTVRYNTSSLAASGVVQLTARSFANPSVSSTGTYSINTGAIPAVAVVVTPDTGKLLGRALGTSDSARFVIKNVGTASASFLFTQACTGAAIAPASCIIVGGSPATIAANDSAVRYLRFTVGAQSARTARVDFVAKWTTDSLIADSGKYDVTTTGTVTTTSVAVTPDDSVVQSTRVGLARSATFGIKNTGATAAVFEYNVGCDVALTCSAVGTSTAQIPPNASQGVSVSYLATAQASSARVRLYATAPGTTTPLDSGSIIVSTQLERVALSLSDANALTSVAREQCLTVAMGEAAASECGDLRLTHPLPMVRTYGTPRVPTLIYSSAHAHPFPLIAVDIRPINGTTALDSLDLTLSVNGVAKYTKRVNPATLLAQGIGRVHLAYDALADTTGLYRIAVSAATKVGSARDTTATEATFAVVNRSGSRLGPGWWVAGLERLVPVNATRDSLLWVGGDGSTRLFTRPSSAATLYRAPSPVTEPESLAIVGLEYERYAKGGSRVRYHFGSGLHLRTINRLGHATVIAYDSGAGATARPKSITVPPAGAGLVYSFVYGGSSLWLDSAIAPAAASQVRRVSLVHDGSGRVTSINGPDTTGIGFAYDPVRTRLVVRRTDRRGVRRTFAYDSAWRVASDSVRLGGPAFAKTTIRGSHQIGLALPGTPLALAADTAAIYTRVDGPRPISDVGDTTGFWLNRFGAPTRIRDALGRNTTLLREDPRFPAAVTQTTSANGRIVTALYDKAGNITERADLGRCNASGCAKTLTQWNDTVDSPSRITQPEGDYVAFTYDPATRNVLTRADARPGSTVEFRYYSVGADSGLLRAVSQPGAATDSVAYDAVRRNPTMSRSPLAYYSHVLSDAVGRDTLTVTPVDSGDHVATYSTTGRRLARTIYDESDRVVNEHQIGPPRSFTLADLSVVTSAAETLSTLRRYDAEGNLTSLRRRVRPQPTGFDTLTTRWSYDSLGRAITETAPDGAVEQYVLDEAGNRKAWVTRRSETVSSAYDALNRLTQRIVPTVTRAPVTGSPIFGPFPYYSPGGLTIPADTAVFGYDSVGNMTRADNKFAWVRRAYDPSGLLISDTLRIFRQDGIAPDHIYALESQYDLNGRRTLLQLPASIAPQVSGSIRDSVRYSYQPTTGLLSSVTDPFGNAIRMTYTLRNEPDSVVGFGTASSSSYNAEGRLTRRSETVGGATVHDDTLTYDAEGKIQVAGTKFEHTVQGYSGLGYLVASERRTQPLGLIESRETNTYDALGNVDLRSATGRLGASPSSNQVKYTYQATSGRQSGSSTLFGGSTSESSGYDSSGNRLLYTQLSNNSIETQYQAYDAAGVLRLVDRRRCAIAAGAGNLCLISPTGTSAAYEEYQHDALGRRIWLRSRRQQWCFSPVSGGYCLGAVQRTVWDGSQVLFEIRYPGDQREPTDSMERDTSSLRPTIDNRCLFDPNCLPSDTVPSFSQYFGRIFYIHGRGIDQPLLINRIGYLSGSSGTITVRPLLNWRAQYDTGTTDMPVRWPAKQTEASLLDRQFDATVPNWAGSVLDGMRDGTGQQYKRARYYDPRTGRFTQEDPIGLAGGLNLYGFANGDPINFADPFGLCTPVPDCWRGWGSLINWVGGTHGIPLSSPTPKPLIRVGGSASGGALTVGCKVGGACGGSVNLTPQYGASVDISVPFRTAGANEPVVTLGWGFNRHASVSISSEEATLSIGTGVGSPAVVSITPATPQPAAKLPLPAVRPDATAVTKSSP